MDNKGKSTLLCGICSINPSKYKCPKCMIPYCSIACFKNETHLTGHEIAVSVENTTSQGADGKVNIDTTGHDNDAIVNNKNDHNDNGISNTKFDKLIKDPIIQAMLQEKSLQFHLLTLVKIMKSPQELKLNNEIIGNRDNKLTIMNAKLNDLRIGGIEENHIIEEFIQRVLTVYNHE